MVDRLAPLPGRLQHDPQMLDQLRLSDELGQRPRAQPDFFELLVVRGGGRVHDARPAGVRLDSSAALGAVSLAVEGQHLPARPWAHRLTGCQLAQRQAQHLFHADIVA